MKSTRDRRPKLNAENGVQLRVLASNLPSLIPVLAEELAIVRAHLGEAIDLILSSDAEGAFEPNP